MAMSVTVEKSKTGQQLVIKLDIETPKPSASGKTLVVASTHGNQKSDCVIEINGKSCPITIGVNAYVKAEK